MESHVLNSYAPDYDAASATAELSVIVPTFNERDNVREIVSRIDRSLTGKSVGGDFRR